MTIPYQNTSPDYGPSTQLSIMDVEEINPVGLKEKLMKDLGATHVVSVSTFFNDVWHFI